MHQHIFQKTVAATIVVICLGLFSLLNMPLTNRVIDYVHYITVHQMNPTELVEAAKPVMQSVRDFNWRRTPADVSSGTDHPPEKETMAAPVNGILTSSYGPRLNQEAGQTEMHYGIDVTAEPGSNVYAAFSGTVSQIKNHPEFGLTIYLQHPDNIVSIYGRVADPVVAAGDKVNRGQELAVVATALTGESHLHFELWENQQPVDPEKYLTDIE
jgi:murein DD-endopeptidase MepM/ murein hydrolase activator NlpD